MKNKRTIYCIILIVICIIELFNPLGGGIVFNLIDEYNCGKIYAVLLGGLFTMPLVLFFISLIWQIRAGKALRCSKKLLFIIPFSQLYLIMLSNYGIILLILFLIFSIAFQTENMYYEEISITWHSFYRKRVLILVCVIILVSMITFPIAKYSYYEKSPYYYRVDEKGYTPANSIHYIIRGTGILKQVDSYYRCDYFGNYKIGWVFKAKRAGVTQIVVQSDYRGGDIEKKIYTIQVDQDKRIKVTGVKETKWEE